jgi:Zn-dependent protease
MGADPSRRAVSIRVAPDANPDRLNTSSDELRVRSASMPTPAGTIRLFEFRRIVVFLHWTWLVVAAYEISGRTGTYSTYIWNVIEYLSLFVIVMLHEFGHALACRSVGGRAEQILLWPLGGIAFVDPPSRPGATLWSLAAGPLVNVALLPILGGLALLISHAMSPDVHALLRSVAFINLGLLFFNLMPIYPLDGGQILGALLWFVIGRARSLVVTAIIGLAGVVGIGLLAVREFSLWLALIALFMAQRCINSFRFAGSLKRATDAPRRQGHACPSCHQAPPIGPFWPCSSCGATFDVFDPSAEALNLPTETTTLNLSAGVDTTYEAVAGETRCPACHTELSSLKCFRCGTANVIADWKTPALTAGWPLSSAPSVTRERRPQAPPVASLVLGVSVGIVTLMVLFVAVIALTAASRTLVTESGAFARHVAVAAVAFASLPAAATMWLLHRYRRSLTAFDLALQRFDAADTAR